MNSTAASPVSFEDVQGLRGVPRVRLAHLPTPLEPLARLREALGVGPRLFVKRDDCTGLAFGGNKARKLEFTLGAALTEGADCLITTGGVQSNHVRQTTAAGAKFGLDCFAVLDCPLSSPRPEYLVSGNRLLDGVLGAAIEVENGGEAAVRARVQSLQAHLRASGRKPFLVPLGASDEVGSLGYVLAAREMLDQAAGLKLDVSHVVLCTGSAGTHAGLLTGLRLNGSDATVVGVSSSEPSAVKIGKVEDIARRILEKLGKLPWSAFGSDTIVQDDYVGDGYGAETKGGFDAIRLVASTEAILLDPVYTGKAMAGLIDLLRRGALDRARDIVFLHTGGTPALFAYAGAFETRGGAQ